MENDVTKKLFLEQAAALRNIPISAQSADIVARTVFSRQRNI
jgi:hypothetical protein